MLDCLVIGGTRLASSSHLPRTLSPFVTIVVDERSRATLIPMTRYHAGFPVGIAGVDRFVRMRNKALVFGCAIKYCTVYALEHEALDTNLVYLSLDLTWLL